MSSSAGCIADATTLYRRIDKFIGINGRRPRILLGHIKKDTHGILVKMLAAAYADAGFDVDISPISRSPEMIARMAVDNDVHVVNVTGFDQDTIVPELKRALKARKADEIVVMADENVCHESVLNQSRTLEARVVRSVEKILRILGA